jgi:hypothetical protein
VLRVNGSQPGSSVVIGAVGVLAGTGRVGKISGSGTISPGSSPGILTGSNLTLSSNMSYQVEIDGPIAGSGYDQIAVNGSVTLAGALNVILGLAPPPDTTFTIIENDGTDPISGTFIGLPQDSLLTFGEVSLQISYTGGSDSNDVTLTYVTPEAPIITALEMATNGAIQFQASGVAGFSYVLEAASSLEPPVVWTPISTNIADPNNVLVFTDADAFLFNMRFYRVRR